MNTSIQASTATFTDPDDLDNNSSRNRHLQDVMAAHMGRPDLVLQLDQEVLPQSA